MLENGCTDGFTALLGNGRGSGRVRELCYGNTPAQLLELLSVLADEREILHSDEGEAALRYIGRCTCSALSGNGDHIRAHTLLAKVGAELDEPTWERVREESAAAAARGLCERGSLDIETVKAAARERGYDYVAEIALARLYAQPDRAWERMLAPAFRIRLLKISEVPLLELLSREQWRELLRAGAASAADAWPGVFGARLLSEVQQRKTQTAAAANELELNT